MLITCPICGKQASDTTDTCVHCGSYLKMKAFNDNKKEKIKFFSLPIVEQLKVESEYLASNYNAQAQKKLFLNQKKYSLIFFISLAIFIIAAIIISSYLLAETDVFTTTSVSKEIINGTVRTVTKKEINPLAPTLLIVGLIAILIISAVVYSKFVKKCNYARNAYFEGFKIWLEDKNYDLETSYLFT